MAASGSVNVPFPALAAMEYSKQEGHPPSFKISGILNKKKKCIHRCYVKDSMDVGTNYCYGGVLLALLRPQGVA